MSLNAEYDEYVIASQYYDHLPLYVQRADVDFYVDLALRSGGPVLELGCGTGRVLLPVARAGVEVCGLDISPSMIARCRQKLAAEPMEVQERVELVQSDMRDFDLGRSFALITTPFRPFQHLVEVEDQIACLAAARRHLRDDGLLVLDLFNPWLQALVDESRIGEYHAEPEFTLPDGRRVVRAEALGGRDYACQVINVELIYYITQPDGHQERHVHAFPMRYFFRYEIEHLLARCGFVVEGVFADYNGTPFGQKYPGELIVMARKKS